MIDGPVLNASSLPVPRLQLRWENTGDADGWICAYEIIIPVGPDDIRNDGSGVLVRELGRTRVLGGPLTAPDGIDAPFRDGAHARWGGRALGLPAYAVHGARAARLSADSRSRHR